MKMKIIKIEDTACIKSLCSGIEETMVYSCLQGCMGTIYATEDLKSVQLSIADFCFFLGVPSKELLKNKVWGDFVIIYLQNQSWEDNIKEIYPAVREHIRYATKKNENHFDILALKFNIQSLPSKYVLKAIDEEVYHQVISQQWSYDLCSQFKTAEEFVNRGIGFVVMDDYEVIAGASSYTIYNEGIEIEIDTRKDKRRQGLARVCASQIILACLEKGIYPSWDAHNTASLDLAVSLGYVFDKEYKVYELSIKELL